MLLYNCSTQQHSGSLNSLKSHWHSLPIKWNVQSKEEKGTSEHTIKRIKRGGGGPRKRKDLKSLSLIMPCSCINWEKKSFSPIHVNIQISLPFEGPSIDDVQLKKFMFSSSGLASLLMKQTGQKNWTTKITSTLLLYVHKTLSFCWS